MTAQQEGQALAGMTPAAPARLDLRIDGPIATIQIVNPARRNAMTNVMWGQLPVLLDGLATDPGVRVLVLTGSDGTFCAGADITEVDRLLVDGDRSLAVLAEQRLADFPKPTIAAIEGHCVGGGCQLAVACDLRFAAHGSRFGITPARLGIVYPTPTTRRLVSLIGPAAAKRLLFSADLIDVDRAAAIGLVDEVIPPDQLTDRLHAFALRLAQRSLLTQAAAKEIIAMGEVAPDRISYWQEQMRESGEAAEGISAFVQRREPSFTWSPPRPGRAEPRPPAA
jgi:enoyl-CoA hydratase/carnithine racemase